MRSLDTVEILIQDLLRNKHDNAKIVFDELSKKWKDKNEVWLHFHPQAGNSLSLTFGKKDNMQLTTISLS